MLNSHEYSLNKWITRNAIIIGVGSLFSLYFDKNEVTLGCVFLSTIYLLVINWNNLSRYHPILGYANWVTLFRLVINTFLFWKFRELEDYHLFFGFLISILLDGIDGWLARHYHQSSNWGALFDKSTDALLVLYLCIILYQKEYVSIFLLGIGLLPYVYELLIYTLGWQDLAIPKNPIGKYVAALLFFALLSPFVLDLIWANYFLFLITIFILLSFSLSFFYKWKAAKRF